MMITVLVYYSCESLFESKKYVGVCIYLPASSCRVQLVRAGVRLQYTEGLLPLWPPPINKEGKRGRGRE